MKNSPSQLTKAKLMFSKKKTSRNNLNDILIKHFLEPSEGYNSIENFIAYFKNHSLCLINSDIDCEHTAPLFLNLKLFSLHKKKYWEATFSLSQTSEGSVPLETPVQHIFSKVLYQALINQGIKSKALFLCKKFKPQGFSLQEKQVDFVAL
jgi:hypothetical protein